VWDLEAGCTPLAATDESITWSSSDANVATVNSQGQVCAKAPGKAVIKAASKAGGLTAECAIQVAKP